MLLNFKDLLCFQVRLEEDFVLQLPFLLPEDNYSCDIIRGVPAGLFEFLAPLQVLNIVRFCDIIRRVPAGLFEFLAPLQVL